MFEQMMNILNTNFTGISEIFVNSSFEDPEENKNDLV